PDAVEPEVLVDERAHELVQHLASRGRWVPTNAQHASGLVVVRARQRGRRDERRTNAVLCREQSQAHVETGVDLLQTARILTVESGGPVCREARPRSDDDAPRPPYLQA